MGLKCALNATRAAERTGEVLSKKGKLPQYLTSCASLFGEEKFGSDVYNDTAEAVAHAVDTEGSSRSRLKTEENKNVCKSES